MDTNNDLALLKVKGKFSALPIINSQSVKKGTHVITIGFPNIDIQGKEPKLSEGIVSALSGIQDEPTVFQISVPIQPGNSGGPMVNMNGNVVGIIASKLSTLYMLKNKGSVPENVNYAIKSNYLNELIQTDKGVSKLLLSPTKQPPKDLVELSERVEKAIALVFVVGKNADVKELAVQCFQAVQAVKEGKYADALNLCKRAATQGNDGAQFFLAIMYYIGKGVPQDYHEAENWFELAAAQGNAKAQYYLGVMHEVGQGVAQNDQEAERWYRLAAMQGDANGQYGLGLLYFYGSGVEQDFQEATKWIRLAAAQGNDKAQATLSVMYIFGSPGVTKDSVRAYMWASLAADKGNRNGQQNRKSAASMMTPSQITEAQEMAAVCLLNNYKNCD